MLERFRSSGTIQVICVCSCTYISPISPFLVAMVTYYEVNLATGDTYI